MSWRKCMVGSVLALMVGVTVSVTVPPVDGASPPIRPIDVNAVVANSGASITTSAYDIGGPEGVFDGDVATLLRSAAVNPATVTVAFTNAVSLSAMRTYFTNGPYRWSVEVADTVAELDARIGSYALVVPPTDTESDVYSTATLPSPVAARVVRLTAVRLTGDDFVHIQEWELDGTSPDQLFGVVRGIAVDSTGAAFVADAGWDQIALFDAHGQSLGAYGSSGSANGSFDEPWDVALGPTQIVVADRGNSRVQIFDPSWKFLRTLGGLGKTPTQMNAPEGVFVDAATNRIYVADTGNHRVQRFAFDGALDVAWGGDGVVGDTAVVRRDNTGFDRPTAVTVSPVNGEVYVADFGNDRIEVYSADGRYRRTYRAVYRPTDVTIAPNGDMYVVGEDPAAGNQPVYDGRLRRVRAGEQLIHDHYNGGLDDLGRVEGGVAMTPTGRIVFTDVTRNRIVSTTAALAPPADGLAIDANGDSVTFRWNTAVRSAGAVRLGSDPTALQTYGGDAIDTAHTVTVTGLTPLTTTWYSVSYPDSFDSSTTRYTRPEPINTGAPAGRTAFARVRTVGMIYTDVDPGTGYSRMSSSVLAAARERLATVADFYWRNSGMKLWLDIRVLEIERNIVGTNVDPGPWLEPDLAAAGHGAADDIDAVLAAAPLGGYNNSGGMTLFGRRIFRAIWSTPWDFTAVHETSHGIDWIYHLSGLPRYEFNHGLWAVPGGLGRDAGLNAQVLRNMLPANFAALDPQFGSIVVADDVDGDGVPSTSPLGLWSPLSITEKTLGSSPTAADTDGDGVSDLAETQALPAHGTSPISVDSDADGTDDAIDTNPAYRMNDRIVRATPAVDGIIDPAEGWTVMTDRWGYSGGPTFRPLDQPDTDALQASTTTYAAWDDSYLYLALRGPASKTEVALDGHADGTFMGPDNYWLTLLNHPPPAGALPVDVRVNVGVPDLFRMIDGDGQWSELFDTDPLFTRPYAGVPFNRSTTQGAGFPGRVVAPADLLYAQAGADSQLVWEVAIPWNTTTQLAGGAGTRIGLGYNVSGDLLFETDHHALVTLVESPPAPTVSVGDATVVEGDSGTKRIPFTLSLAAAPLETVAVKYATTAGTATAGSDYIAKSGTVTFSAGQTSKTVTVLVKGDRLVEPDETFSLDITSVSGATIADGSGLATIIDNDGVAVSVGDAKVVEGNAGRRPIHFEVSLSARPSTKVAVSYATTAGTATAGSDFIAKSGTVTFGGGQTSKTVIVLVKGDRLVEPDETFSLDITSVSGATIADGSGLATIIDNDRRASRTVS